MSSRSSVAEMSSGETAIVLGESVIATGESGDKAVAMEIAGKTDTNAAAIGFCVAE